MLLADAIGQTGVHWAVAPAPVAARPTCNQLLFLEGSLAQVLSALDAAINFLQPPTANGYVELHFVL